MKKVYIVFFLLYTSVFTSFAQIAEKDTDVSPLLIGEKIPNIEVTSIHDKKVPLATTLSKKPSVLLFYRGGWCPFCNRHLSAVGEIEDEIKALGYQIIAFSPDSPEKLKASKEKGQLGYKLFSDAKGELIQAMGIAFKAPERYADKLSNFSNGENTGFLPLPSAFVVDVDGTILFEYISPNYKQRITSNMLLAVLKALK